MAFASAGPAGAAADTAVTVPAVALAGTPEANSGPLVNVAGLHAV